MTEQDAYVPPTPYGREYAKLKPATIDQLRKRMQEVIALGRCRPTKEEAQ